MASNNQNTQEKVSPLITPINSPSLSPTLNSPPTSPTREGSEIKSPRMFSSPRNSPNNSPRIRNSPQGGNNNSKLEPSKDYTPIIEPLISVELEAIKTAPIKNFGDSLSSLLEKESEILSIVQSELQSRKGHTIPVTVVQIIEFLRCYGALKEPGLFRVCGKHTELVILQKQVEDGFCLGFEDMRSYSIHSLGDLLKHFLRKLSSPIIPTDFTYYFLVTSLTDDKSVIEKYLAALLKLLPKENFELLKYICKFFHELIEHSSSNMMGSSNLAIIFAPLFFGPSLLENSRDILIETQATSKVAQYLIDHYSFIFTSSQMKAGLLVAYESYSGDGINFAREDEVIVYDRNEELYFVQVNGKFFTIPVFIIDCMCKAKDPNYHFNEKVLELRERSLLKLMEESHPQALPHSSNYIKLSEGKENDADEKKAKKKRSATVDKKDERKLPSRSSWYGAITAKSTSSLFGQGGRAVKERTNSGSSVLNLRERAGQIPFSPRGRKSEKQKKEETKKEKIEEAITEWSGEKIKKLKSHDKGVEKSISDKVDKVDKAEKVEKEAKTDQPKELPEIVPNSPKGVEIVKNENKELLRTASGRRLSF